MSIEHLPPVRRKWLDHIRPAFPNAFVRLLSERKRCAHFRLAVRRSQWSRLPRIVGTPDPFIHSALFAGVDLLLSDGRDADIPRLAPLSEGKDAYIRGVFKALCKHAEGDTDRAIAHLERYGAGQRFDGYRRMCARAWALFLQLPRLRDVSPLDGSATDIMQFWDKPTVPADVFKEIQGWRNHSGLSHRLFDAAGAREFVTETYGSDAVRAFDLCAHPVIQSDYFRLAWIADRGGLYIDADEKMRDHFPRVTTLFPGRVVLRFCTNQADGHFLNGFIAAPPRTSLLEEAFDEATKRLLGATDRHVYALSGPGMLTTVLLRAFQSGNLANVAIVPHTTTKQHLSVSIKASYKQDDRSWHLWQTNRGNSA